MRSIRQGTAAILILAGLGFLAGVARADQQFANFSQPYPDWGSDVWASIADSGVTLGYQGDSIPIVAPDGICWNYCTLEAQTGALLRTSGDIMTFAGGGSLRESGQTTARLTDCGALEPDPFGGCFVPNEAQGYFTGPVTVTHTQHTGDSDLSWDTYVLTGPIEFSLSPEMADFLQQSEGLYFGTYDAQFTLAHYYGGEMQVSDLEQSFSGFTTAVPEPASWCLLAAALLFCTAAKLRCLHCLSKTAVAVTGLP